MPNVNASAQLRGSAARLRAAGAVGVKNAMVRDLRAAAAPVAVGIQAEARASLPKRGGLNNNVADRKIVTSVRTTGRQAGVRLGYVNASGKGVGRFSDTGEWRHPVFSSSRKRWTKQAQSFPGAAGWWKRGAEKGEVPAQVVMRGILNEVAAEIMRLGI